MTTTGHLGTSLQGNSIMFEQDVFNELLSSFVFVSWNYPELMLA